MPLVGQKLRHHAVIGIVAIKHQHIPSLRHPQMLLKQKFSSACLRPIAALKPISLRKSYITDANALHVIPTRVLVRLHTELPPGLPPGSPAYPARLDNSRQPLRTCSKSF